MEYLFIFIINFIVFLAGISIGSFLNVLIWRIPQKMNFINSRSICPACGTQIKNYDLIPVLSYVLLGGKCRGCGARISPRYPAVELLTGFLFVLTYFRYSLSPQFAVAAAALSILITVAMIDFDTREIPNGLVIAMLLPAAASFFVFPETGIIERLIGFFAISLPMYLLALLIAGAFGGGDIKLMAVCGFMLGWKSCLLAFFIALLTGGFYAFSVILRKNKAKRTMAFGPYLCAGIYVSLLYGRQIIDFYISFAFS